MLPRLRGGKAGGRLWSIARDRRDVMNKSEVLKRIRDTGLIPVVRAESSDLALRAVAALKAGGLDVLEVTMTVPGAIEVIQILAAEFGD
jgi:2-dehydro-3-deoxyphosphogluconate aldolase/(4S)-4-hydroxy-2-oxoglutarate aldolase